MSYFPWIHFLLALSCVGLSAWFICHVRREEDVEQEWRRQFARGMTSKRYPEWREEKERQMRQARKS